MRYSHSINPEKSDNVSLRVFNSPALTMQGKPAYLATLLQSCIDKKTHHVGKILHAHILRTGFVADTFLSNRLIELYFKCNNIGYARNVFDKMLMKERNLHSWNAMLSGYCKAGNLKDACNVFMQMRERNVVSWNNLISALLRSGMEHEALDFYGEMIRGGFVPTNFTLASVFSACGGVLDVEAGKASHGLTIKIGLDKNMYVGNALLAMYAKCGCMEEAIQAFEDIPEPNEVTFTAIVGGLSQIDRVAEALRMFRMMCRKGICIDSVSLSSILGVCARSSSCLEPTPCNQNDGSLPNVHGKQVHSLTIKLGFERDLHLNNSLLDMYVKNGDMESAEMIFSNLAEVSVVSWNVMIAGYGQSHNNEKAIEYLQRMQSCGFEPDEVTYINMLAACVKSGDIKTARCMFNSMTAPSVSSWNAMLSAYSQSQDHKAVVKLFREMQFRNIQPDRTTLAIILSSCAELSLLEAGKQVHAVSQKAGLHTDLYVASGIIGIYSKCKKIEMAECIFYGLPEQDIVCWNTMIAGLSLNSRDIEAFTTFKHMQQRGMLPTEFSYATVLSCCAKLSSSLPGRQIHTLITKDGFDNDVYVGSALIGMYCKCGDVDGARCFFDMMPGKSTVTWNEMIHGYAQNGNGEEAVHLYKKMIELGEKPDGITFVAVLTACSHSGLVDEGIKIFNSMQQHHNVEPDLDHYTCIIDSLGRAARFLEAEVLLDKIPYKNDPVIWEVLLSSCRIHDNVELAKRAADELFHLDPQNSAPYVLLANMYAALGRWDDARAVRELMNDRQVSKDPGFSWIEHKTEMYDNCRVVNDDSGVVNN